MLVLDANILIRAILGRRVRQLLEAYAGRGLRFCAPEAINRDAYEHLESEARERLRGRDEDDWPVLATALSLSCAIWTEDAHFFGAGVAQWTSDRVEIFLRNEANIVDQDEG